MFFLARLYWFDNDKISVEYLPQTPEDNYTGYKEVTLSDDDLAFFYSVTLQNNLNSFQLLENEYLLLKREGHPEIVDKYKWKDGKYNELPYYKFPTKYFGKVLPRDDYQLCAFDSLSTNRITVLRGHAGTGKSFAAISYMFYLLEKGMIDKIVIFCNTVATFGAAKLGLEIG